MKNIYIISKIGLKQITKDFILCALIVAPLLLGLVLKIGVPLLNREFNLSLEKYYLLFDIFAIFIIPMLSSMIITFLILDELDNQVITFYPITPYGRRAYIISRIYLPQLLAFIYCFVILFICNLSHLSMFTLLFASFYSIASSLLISYIVITFAKNKVEGMAISKLSSLLFVGIPASWFINGISKYAFAFLPSFWLSETILYNNYVFFVIGILWTACLIYLFNQKVYSNLFR